MPDPVKCHSCRSYQKLALHYGFCKKEGYGIVNEEGRQRLTIPQKSRFCRGHNMGVP